MEILVTAVAPIIAFLGYLFFLIYLPRLTPPDLDSANHLRLAQLWARGVGPSHPYSLGVKWAAPRLYRFFFSIVSKNWNRYRMLVVFQATFTHVALPHLGLPQTVPTWLLHVAMFLLNISPLVFPLTSSLDMGTVVIFWSTINTFVLGTGGGSASMVAVAGILLVSLLWKMVDLIYVIPVVGIILLGGYNPYFFWGGTATLFVVAALSLLALLVKKNGPLQRAVVRTLAYRATRSLRRKKVLWPLLVFLGVATALFLVAHLSGEGIRHMQLLAMMGTIALVRNIISGDFVTGPGSYHLYFPLFVFASSSGILPLGTFVAIFFSLACMVYFLSPSKNIGNRMRLLSQGGRFPNDADALAKKVEFCRRFEASGSNAVLVGSDSLLALILDLHADSDRSYTSIHSQQWGMERSDAQSHLDRGRILILSGLLESDQKEVSTLVGVDFNAEPLLDIALASKKVTGPERSLKSNRN